MTLLPDILPWTGFILFLVFVLGFDLLVLRPRETSPIRGALKSSALWLGAAALFGAAVFVTRGSSAGTEWSTAFALEKLLSLDNAYLIALIFAAHHVPLPQQRALLAWGAAGAFVMRALLLASGLLLMSLSSLVVYGFGVFALWSAWHFWRHGNHAPLVGESRLARAITRRWPLAAETSSRRLFIRVDGVRAATPFLLLLVLVEGTDLFLAIESVPAMAAVTSDPYIAVTSNLMALAGIRSMAVLAGAYLPRLAYLKAALSGVLLLAGLKLIGGAFYKPPAEAFLAAVAFIVATAVAASLLSSRRTGSRPANSLHETIPDTSARAWSH